MLDDWMKQQIEKAVLIVIGAAFSLMLLAVVVAVATLTVPREWVREAPHGEERYTCSCQGVEGASQPPLRGPR